MINSYFITLYLVYNVRPISVSRINLNSSKFVLSVNPISLGVPCSVFSFQCFRHLVQKINMYPILYICDRISSRVCKSKSENEQNKKQETMNGIYYLLCTQNCRTMNCFLLMPYFVVVLVVFSLVLVVFCFLLQFFFSEYYYFVVLSVNR